MATMWTNEQLDAINKEGTNIIVSAGAGSGKPVLEAAAAAAAGGKGSASDIRSIEDDNRYGKNRRPCRRYF